MRSQTTLLNGCGLGDIVGRLRRMAVHSLARMYRPEERLFAFRLRKAGLREVPEGISRRYTAIVLISLADEESGVVAEVLGSHRPEDVCGQLLADLENTRDLGEVALTAWAAGVLHHPAASAAVRALLRMEPGRQPYPTIELSWTLMALLAQNGHTADGAQAKTLARALLACFCPESGIFRRWSAGSHVPKFRAHASCFANFVYPIQALSHYHLATGDAKAAEAALHCAERMCRLQGPDGQWWWYFDSRTGRVLERYPVYAVHQDAMAPMALFALAKACGRDYSTSVEKGLRWLANPSEKVRSLIDTERNVIWRKVARREPVRIVRGLQAAVSRLHPHLRVPGVDILFPPVATDYESRPYHMGWILYAWPVGRESLPLKSPRGLRSEALSNLRVHT